MCSGGQPSEKFTIAALACACTRCDESSIAPKSAGKIAACAFSWIFGPRSVQSCPMAFTAAQRTRGCGSEVATLRAGAIAPLTSFSMPFEQPSAICASATSAAWRLRQSASANNAGIAAAAQGSTVLAPSAMATRSRHSCPTSYLSPSPASPSSSFSHVCHSGSSSTSSKNAHRQLNSLGTKSGSLRIMPGARSRASVSVTKNSHARWRVPSSKSSCVATVIIASTTCVRCFRTNRGSLPASSTNKPSASCASASSPPCNAAPSVASIAGNRSWNFDRSEGFSRLSTKQQHARNAAS